MEVESALGLLGWEGKSILSSGRTDSGVHASGQVIAFELDWAHTPADLANALNAGLPEDVVVQQAEVAAAGFHPRYDAVERTYRYRIYLALQRDPLRERFAWRLAPGVNLDLLEQAAAHLPGSHDFAAFGNPPQQRREHHPPHLPRGLAGKR